MTYFRLFEKHALAKYIAGQGIEIGALDNPFPIDRSNTTVLYVDLFDRDRLIQMNPETPASKIVNPDIIGSAEDLPGIASESMDFVIAAHVLEHVPNPIKALLEMHRVLKNGGILYLAVPDMRYTFDCKRPLTPFIHVLEDYKKGTTAELCDEHYFEWVEYVEKTRSTPVAKNVDEAKQYRIHYHVWIPESILEILAFLANDLHTQFLLVNHYYKRGDHEFILLLKRMDHVRGLFQRTLPERFSLLRYILHKLGIAIHKFIA